MKSVFIDYIKDYPDIMKQEKENVLTREELNKMMEVLREFSVKNNVVIYTSKEKNEKANKA